MSPLSRAERALFPAERAELATRVTDQRLRIADLKAIRASVAARDAVENDWAADGFPIGDAGLKARRALCDRKAFEAKRAVYLRELEECFR